MLALGGIRSHTIGRVKQAGKATKESNMFAIYFQFVALTVASSCVVVAAIGSFVPASWTSLY